VLTLNTEEYQSESNIYSEKKTFNFLIMGTENSLKEEKSKQWIVINSNLSLQFFRLSVEQLPNLQFNVSFP